jgi:RNA polymerase sigma factor (sigma-70 family)
MITSTGKTQDQYRVMATSYPLLTRDDEVSLAQAIEDGLEAKGLLDEDAPEDQAERLALIERQGRGAAAERKLVLSNLRLVVSIAKKMQTKLPYADLVQEGNIGLLQAARKFDYRKGYRFSTYAYNWVMMGMRNASRGQRMIRLPARAARELSTVAAARDKLQVELGRNPTVAEQAQRTGMTVDKISKLLESRHDATSSDAFENFEKWYGAHGDDAKPAEAGLLDEERTRVITEDLLPKLDERERTVIELKYGLNGNEVHDGVSIINKLGCSRGTYQKLESNALWRLKYLNRGIAKNLFDSLIN